MSKAEKHDYFFWQRLTKEHTDLLTQALAVEAERDIVRIETERLQTDRERYNHWTAEIKAGIDDLKTNNELLRAALEPVRTIYCPLPDSASQADSFGKGSPLTPAQVRTMQEAIGITYQIVNGQNEEGKP